MLEKIKGSIPELPDAKKQRMMTQYLIGAYDAEVLSSDKAVASYYEAVVLKTGEPKLSSNWIQTEVMRVLNEKKIRISDFCISSDSLAELVKMVKNNLINQNTAKDVFNDMLSSGDTAKNIVAKKGLSQIQDESAIEKMVEEVIAESVEQIKQYKEGKTNVMGYLVGVVMKKSKGKANPQIVNVLLKKKLD